MKNQPSRRSSQKDASRWEWLKNKMEKMVENRPLGNEEQMELMDLPQNPPRGYSSEPPRSNRDYEWAEQNAFGFLGMDGPPPQPPREKDGKTEGNEVHQQPEWGNMWGWDGPPPPSPERMQPPNPNWEQESQSQSQNQTQEPKPPRGSILPPNRHLGDPMRLENENETQRSNDSRRLGGTTSKKYDWEELPEMFDESEDTPPPISNRTPSGKNKAKVRRRDSQGRRRR
ncbi:hypothetical protein [Marininema halotolerans]|uniref:Uncharacterized protein n=1 Tax=Marininema halotolerans TaxID=1155944 RepID=A0A1I6QG33_9BACL|nr:hypothetical protein [Marininema halotolerans]SFS51362.1 hypothetical protein SAMN05444972_103129 [Marininema halotolerans]